MLKQLMVLVLALGCPAQSNNKPLQSSLQRYKAEGFLVLLPQ